MSQAFDEMYTLIEHTAEASKRITSETMSQLNTSPALVETALHSDPTAAPSGGADGGPRQVTGG